MSENVVIFDAVAFKGAYPQLASFTDAQLQNAFDIACLILNNTIVSPVADVSERKTLLWLLVCHMATLEQRGGTVVGTLSSASEGSVSTGFTLPQQINGAWFSQTQSGLIFWQATLSYRQGRYYAGHTFHRG